MEWRSISTASRATAWRLCMSALEEKKIAIVGGGPGGLTLARLLQQCGAEIAVYERDQSRSARVQGSALDS